MRRLSLTFFALLTGSALVGLGLSWFINLTLFGRPHGALLRLLAETAADAIDCQDPGHSPLFHNQAKFSPLNLILVDAKGEILGRRGQAPERPPLPQDMASHRFPFQADNPLRADHLWVRVDLLCGQDWTLWAYDPNNQLYRHMILPRQMVLYFACCSCIIVFVMIAYLFLRNKGLRAQSVLQNLRRGEWSSRIPQSFWEPRLQLIDEFNSMAAAVGESFQRLQKTEERRTRLLSELAHDIRTPLASVCAAAETLREFHSSLSEFQREKLQETLMLDLHYFQRLIDDLLILAQLDRLDSLPSLQFSDLRSLLPLVWQTTCDQRPDLQTELRWPEACPPKLLVQGEEQLLRRLLQNTLVNAVHYAKTWVRIRIQTGENRLLIEVSNDSAVLSEEDIQGWGHKRRQRIITEKAGQPHTSLGLGSSIIVGVTKHLGGEAWLTQTLSDAKDTSQVHVFIEFPWPIKPGKDCV